MGKYMRQNCKGIREIAVMEVAHVGVRTRARALSMAAAASARKLKRRKVSGGESTFSSSLSQLRSRRREVVAENSVSPAASGNSYRAPASCCSSNASSDVANESVEIVDLEDASFEIESSTCNFGNRGRKKSTPPSDMEAESGDLESTVRATEANSRRRLLVGNMPSETELDEFFTAAEKHLQKRFTEKYNYDIAKDMPLEGRYEWIQPKS